MNKRNIRDFIIHSMVKLTGYSYDYIYGEDGVLEELYTELKVVAQVGLLNKYEADEIKAFIETMLDDPEYIKLTISGFKRFVYPADFNYNDIAELISSNAKKKLEEARK